MYSQIPKMMGITMGLALMMLRRYICMYIVYTWCDLSEPDNCPMRHRHQNDGDAFGNLRRLEGLEHPTTMASSLKIVILGWQPTIYARFDRSSFGSPWVGPQNNITELAGSSLGFEVPGSSAWLFVHSLCFQKWDLVPILFAHIPHKMVSMCLSSLRLYVNVHIILSPATWHRCCRDFRGIISVGCPATDTPL